VRFLRSQQFALRKAAWMLKVSFSVLGDWDKVFDEDMRPFHIPDGRGKTAKITLQMVRDIVRAAEELKDRGKRLKTKNFTRHLKEEHGIVLGNKKVQEVLIANNLMAARTRKRRPGFYQSLRKQIPNGLVSLDGSEMMVWLDDRSYKFNVELAVDVKTFTHTGSSVGDTETAEEIIKVLEAHRRDWGTPLGMLCDSGSSNLSESVGNYLRIHNIEPVPAGPSNPKGNGTDEGAFSQMKRVVGTIHLDLSSPKSLAKSVLEKVISIYITMRNRIPVKGSILAPPEGMKPSASEFERDRERQHLRDHVRKKTESQGDQSKLDQIHGLIDYHDIKPEPAVLKRAEKTIKAFEKEAIFAASKAFIKAVNRKPERKNLPYFFGILKRIQQERDEEAYRRYCYQRYNEQQLQQSKRQAQEYQQSSISVEGVVEMLVKAVNANVRFIKDLSIRKARQWTRELMESYRYPGALKKRFSDALGTLTEELSLDHKNRIWEFIEQFLKSKTTVESVT
jgi:hypothetical protein